MKLTELKGIGDKTEQNFGKLKIYDVEGLLQAVKDRVNNNKDKFLIFNILKSP